MLIRYNVRLLLRYSLLAGLLIVAFTLLLLVLSQVLTPPDVGATTRDQNAMANGMGGGEPTRGAGGSNGVLVRVLGHGSRSEWGYGWNVAGRAT